MNLHILNPLDYKYCLSQGRYRTTKLIFGQRRYRSHLAYAYYYRILFKRLLEILDLGYVIHHLDGNMQNDEKHNLRLWLKNYHHSYHSSSEETKKKISQSRKERGLSKGIKNPKYNHSLKNEDIIELVVNQDKSLFEVGKILKVNNSSIHYRLTKTLGYKFSARRRIWIK